MTLDLFPSDDALTSATQLSASTTINASKSQVWDVISNIGEISKFHPMLKESRLTNDKTGEGARRHCEMKPMGSMDEKIVKWEEGSGFTAMVTGGKMLPPVQFMIGQIALTDDGSGCMASFTLSYKLKGGALGKVMDQLMVKPMFKSAPVKYVEGLKDYVESNGVGE